MNLPTKEQFEEWNSSQVASYLSQNNMQECAVTVQRMRIDGQRFLCLSDNDLSRFNLIHRPQLQKMVQDIKKNDDSILNRLKRFQTEQTANILKTGRNTLDRIKNKGPPKLPTRDYPGDNQDSAQSSDSEFDSDLYEDPQYEPPPCEKDFTTSPSNKYPAGEYLDTTAGRQTQTKFTQPFLPAKPPIPIKPNLSVKCDEDYEDPESDEEDNYIDPSEKDHHVSQERSCSPDVYEVPDLGDSEISHRCSTKLQPNVLKLPPKPSPRTNIRKPGSCPEAEDEDDDYEVCNDDDSLNEEQENKVMEAKQMSIPIPLPREQKNPKPPIHKKPSFHAKDHEVKSQAPSTKMTCDPGSQVTNTNPKGFYIANRITLNREIPCQKSPVGRGCLSQEDSATRQQEEEAGVYKKPWYASTCDRKTAENALVRSAKDGSYLLRKSSGVDTLQPYTLVVYYNGRVYNIPVRYIPTTKQYALGKQKTGEERFKTVSDIIENHQVNALVLVDMQSNTKDSTKLRHAVKP